MMLSKKGYNGYTYNIFPDFYKNTKLTHKVQGEIKIELMYRLNSRGQIRG